MLSNLMSSDAVWMVVAAGVLPTLGSLWWYTIHKVSHLYSKVSELKEIESVQAEQIERLRHDARNQRMIVDYNSEQLKAREMDVNYLYWAQLQKDGGLNEQGFQAPRSIDRQSTRRPQ